MTRTEKWKEYREQIRNDSEGFEQWDAMFGHPMEALEDLCRMAIPKNTKNHQKGEQK